LPVTRETGGTMSTVPPREDLFEMLAKARPPRGLAAGELICTEGDPGDAMYLVTAGSVVLSKGDEVVTSVSAPATFGELALIDDSPRSLTARAETDIELVMIPARLFWVLVHETPYFAHMIMSQMAERLRERDAAGAQPNVT